MKELFIYCTVFCRHSFANSLQAVKEKKPCHKEPMFFCAVTQEAKILKCDTSRPWEMVTRIENVWVEWKIKLSVKNIVKLLVCWKSKALSPSVSSAERSWWYHGRKQTEEALGTQTSLLSITLKECWGSFMWKCLIRPMRAISIPVKRRFEKVRLKAIWLSLWCGLGTKCVRKPLKKMPPKWSSKWSASLKNVQSGSMSRWWLKVSSIKAKQNGKSGKKVLKR